MTDKQILELIEKEFEEKSLGVTEQYLEIHSPVIIDNKIKIDRIDREKNDGDIIAYIPVIGESFHFAVYINPATKEIGLTTKANHKVYFRASSETLTSNDLLAITTVTPTEYWNKGEQSRYHWTK